MSWNMWLAFLAAAVVIAVSPGPGAVLSMATGLRHGYAVALRAILGLQTALLIQLAIVVLGLGAVLAASATAFLIVKIAGAGYLIWLGVRKWRAPVELLDDGTAARDTRGVYLQGVLVNLTNPKAIVFMVALVPQFIDPQLPQWPQFLIIATTMVGTDMVVMSCYALLAGRCRRWLRSPRMMKAQNRVFGGMFVAAGSLLAASSR
ncbi:MAG: homoserine/homoserine lactone efflux protein [Azoarcus sp.]|uniref:Homoserine/homoserine lactone efflux protein n=1 Tax=Aromatoleum tolulyticum TaxID=34027 RepID=A0A1N6Z660_9RHOO|nr:homoserine/homoserine lactone efflux protein [Aromatoleum tolulyticum]MCK9986983.1 homoserine/homoserine lactone efflux protein [Azoarcus sp.]SIR22332.1 homoserine/homoserine lactone efflux protein [Aromatoleum tolulyticum]